ncbi:MAG TPA: amidohydrolase family protein [Cystobacter sp.]
MDAHSHLLLEVPLDSDGSLLDYVARTSTAERALLGAKLGREMLEAGFTTVRDLGNSGRNGDVALRKAIQEGWVTGPRLSAPLRVYPRARATRGADGHAPAAGAGPHRGGVRHRLGRGGGPARGAAGAL